MRTALRPMLPGRRPPVTGGGEVALAGQPWSFLALGARRSPVGKRLSAPERRLPARSRIVLRAGSVLLR
jgi:hypothetical protein